MKPNVTKASSIVWFRLDLRLADNPALQTAVAHGGPVVPVFIYAPGEEAPWEPGAASRWWLHQSLASFQARLRAAGSRLIIRLGPSLGTLKDLLKETGANSVFWNHCYEPAVIARDAKVKEALRAEGFQAESFNAGLLHEPWTIKNQSGKPFQVFTPFWRNCLARPGPGTPVPAPRKLTAPQSSVKSLPLDALELLPRINWAGGLRAAWTPGEVGAAENLGQFLAKAFDAYGVQRNRPDLLGTSRLSPHLHFGELSPRQVWHGLARFASKRELSSTQWRSSQFLTELGWREFAHHLLFHFPHTPNEPLRADFKKFPWRKDPSSLRAWQRGCTGYPIVDAGMRELWSTGWMHNRVRMIVASFLIKDLLLAWTEGARWFWDTLVDADLAQNTLGWQWTAGCGGDASPFFRVFNPVSQGQKFDPLGNYVRRWCPELSELPDKWIHQPWAAPSPVKYPPPIVSHVVAREVALEAFARIKSVPL